MTPKRNGPQRIRQALEQAEAGMSVRDLAAVAGLHENAVRRTLAMLVAEEEVFAERKASGARGRPVAQYRLVGSADEPFKQLLPPLLDLLRPAEGSAAAAYARGRSHGEALPAPASGNARSAAIAWLTTLGFSPVERHTGAPSRTTLDLTRCPFADVVTTSPGGKTICHLHHGLLAGVVGGAGGQLDEFVINDPRSHPCRLVLRNETPQRAFMQ